MRTIYRPFIVIVVIGILFSVNLLTTISVNAELTYDEHKLLASDGQPEDFFGDAVAIDGDTAVVGAPWNSEKGHRAGAAYVFENEGTGWVEKAKLTAGDPGVFDQFGYSVDISGDIIVIGANLDDDNGISSGSAYVFVRDGTDWTQQAKLTASDGTEYDNFGYSVAIDGDTIAIGAYGDERYFGLVYVFERSGAEWTEVDKIHAKDPVRRLYFGSSVDICGDTIAVGAYFFNSGSAFVFKKTGTEWFQEAKFTPSDSRSWNFGWSVAVDGDTVIVGAKYGGIAYVYRQSGTTWTEEAKLNPDDTSYYFQFGGSVDIKGDTAVVGAKFDDDNGNGAGAEYIFQRTGSAWIMENKFLASDGETGDYFGISSSFDGQNLIVGASNDDDNGIQSGSAYIFELSLDIGDMFDDLIETVKEIGLPGGTDNSLCVKLENAKNAYNEGKYNAARGMLGAFIGQVEALAGKKLSNAQADELIQEAREIISELSNL